MKTITQYAITALFVLTPACLAQKWDVGGVSGGGFYNHVGVSNVVGSATAGLGNGFGFGAILGQNVTDRLSGEMRYEYQFNDLKVSSSGEKVTFAGRSHSMHYDVLFHSRSARSRVRPFVALGGGVRVFRGTGTETSYQALSSFALLTKTQEWKPMVTFGGGVKYALSPRLSLRVEVRDFLTTFPVKVIAPAPGSHLSGWLHDLVPMIGITFTF